MTIKKLNTVLLVLLTVLFMGILICAGLLFGNDSEGNSNTGLSSGGNNVSLEVLRHRPLIEKYAKESGVLGYVPTLLAIIRMESGGMMEGVMQSSGSARFPPSSLGTEASIRQGCIYFASLVNRAKDIGYDQESTIQPYNYGGGYLNYVGKNGKKYSSALAESFSKEKSDGEEVTHPNPIATKENSGWCYSYGNMFYVVLVKQCLTTTKFNDKTVQGIFNEASKCEGTAYVFEGLSPATGFDCSRLTQWCYAKVSLQLLRVAQGQYDTISHIELKDAKPGDLIFFHSTYDTGTYVTHIDIYAGGSRTFHTGDPVGWANLTETYW